MVKFKIQTYINQGEGQLFKFNQGTDLLVKGPVVEVEAADEMRALSEAWSIGNRMSANQPWPSRVRSLCMGDVCVIGKTAWEIKSVGFEKVPMNVVKQSLSSGRRDPRWPT